MVGKVAYSPNYKSKSEPWSYKAYWPKAEESFKKLQEQIDKSKSANK